MFPNSVVNWHRVGVDGGVYNNQAWKYSEVRKTTICARSSVVEQRTFNIRSLIGKPISENVANSGKAKSKDMPIPSKENIIFYV